MNPCSSIAGIEVATVDDSVRLTFEGSDVEVWIDARQARGLADIIAQASARAGAVPLGGERRRGELIAELQAIYEQYGEPVE